MVNQEEPVEEKEVLRALDDLFVSARRYRSSKEFKELITFVSKFRFYSPYNAMLIHIQKPGARFVCPASRWKRQFGRKIKAEANPLIILQPMGPVMFVFDVSDTESGPNALPLPSYVENPFEVRSGNIGQQLEWAIENAKRDGVEIISKKEGSQLAGFIMAVSEDSSKSLLFRIGTDQKGFPIYRRIPVRYCLLLNENLSRESRYATLTHELGHLYCGHLGTPNRKWWPNRNSLEKTVREFEAETVSFLVCSRKDIDNPSDRYLSVYLNNHDEIPSISPEAIMKAAGVIEQMGKERMKLRKD